MEELKTWWEMAQIAGAGATFILGPVAWLLWRRNEKDSDYIRQADRDTLTVLSELTKTLENQEREKDHNNENLMNAIKNSTESIKAHINSTLRKD